jgi:O-antigen/teichoic acid export membrane protein
MGIVRNDAVKTTVISFLGLILGYVNKGFLFILLFSTDQIGLINLIVTVGVLLAQLSNFGSIYTIWRFFPFFRNKEKDHYGFLLANILIVLLGLFFFISISLLFKSNISSFYEDRSILFVERFYLIYPLGIATVYFLIFENYMRGLNKNVLPVILNDVVLRVLIFVLLVLFWMKIIGFDLFLYLFISVHFIPPVFLFFTLFNSGELTLSLNKIKIPKKFRKIILNYGLFSYLNSIGALVVLALDALMIASFLGLKETGVYTTVIYLISAIQIPFRSLIRVCSPIVSLYWKERNYSKMNALYKDVSSISLIIGLYFFAIIWLNINELFSFLSNDFQEGKYVFLFIMIGRLFDMYSGLNGIILSTSKKFKFDLILTIFLLAGVFFLNLLLIPLYGISGAAISTALVYILYNIVRLVAVYHFFQLHFFEKNQLKVLVLFTVVFFLLLNFNIELNNRMLAIGFKSILFSCLFLMPIIYFKWNNHLEEFKNKWMVKLLNKKGAE